MHAFPTVRYSCDHCRKTLSSASKMRKHEATCSHRPESRSCLTCDHFYGDTHDGDRCSLGKDISLPLPRNCDEWLAENVEA